MPIRYIDEINPKHLVGVALLRLDFNTEDDWRMRATLPTVRLLTARARAVLVLSHRGRPEVRDHKLSLRRDAACLARLLGKPVYFAQTITKARRKLLELPTGSVLVLENLRFEKGEEKNDRAFARRLASLGNYFVNDAFPVSHRANASVSAITEFLPSYGGLSMKQEIKNLSRVMRKPKRPLVMIFGGAKISDKLAVFVRFRDAADRFLVGGALANTLLAFRGMDVKDSLVEEVPRTLRAILRYPNVYLPDDFAWHGRKIFDIGPRTAARFAKEIAKARTVVWNGPVGVFEKSVYAGGTKAVGAAIARNRKAYTVVGGGETVAALKRFGLDKRISFISTGGGAMLEFLSGKKLPGIVALERGGRWGS
ncbi:MAG: phosphoglycerate kinase [bacterium]|nr:phosphoglycerate kinase [bacterium]